MDFQQADTSAHSSAYQSVNNEGYTITKRNGKTVPLDINKMRSHVVRIAQDSGVLHDINPDMITQEVVKNIFDGITIEDLERALILSSAVFIEQDPSYDNVASRFLLQKVLKEVIGCSTNDDNQSELYKQAFVKSIEHGVQQGIFDKRMLEYDLEKLSQAINLKRDYLIGYMGLGTLYSRYFSKINGKRIETPQAFWMRVAMGLALQEPLESRHDKVIEFYTLISTLEYLPSTPSLFHSGFPRAQLSSCYLTTVDDDLGHIFKCVGDNAQLAKWAGGIGSDWTNVRATGALIKSIKATSQGVIPYLKIANDVVVAITRSGIRRGGTCVYLETWHFDIEDFLDLRRNTGDERRRTHDMNTANWVPDLFIKRVINDEQWTLFSPEETPELHKLYGAAFEKKYCEYEQKAQDGHMSIYKTVSAKQLWRKMLTRLFETGHPWITFKDACNVRSPQDHVGVVNSSNLCTEITLNTSEDETAVCNLGSVNLSHHITSEGKLDDEKLRNTVKSAIRMLDNVIDLNFYPTQEAAQSNYRHRPVGLGLMGLQDGLFKLDIPFASQDAHEFIDSLMEKISYYAIETSSELAQERGTYSSYKGSKWDRGIFPLDTVDMLEKERGVPVEVSRTKRLDWDALKARVKKHGMRNSNLMAIAPTATISTIAGCYPSIEPIYENIYVESNISGEFTIVNKFLVDDLKKHGLWGPEMLNKLKYFDGNLHQIDEVPDYLKAKYQTAFDLDQEWLMELGAVRSKWIDQSQSHNIFLQGVSGSKLNSIYMKAWKTGMKTTYYLRALGATQIEKSTLDAKYGYTQKRSGSRVCSINVEDCESCQ
jgi:ribonucleoside-diphosphate reductase alpha chain